MTSSPSPQETPDEGLDVLFEQIRSEVEAETGWLAKMRELSRSRAAALVIGLVLGSAGGWLLFAPRADMSHYPVIRLAVEFGALILLAASAGWTFVRPLSQAQPRPNAIRLRMVAHLVVAAAIVSAPEAHSAEPFVGLGVGEHYWPSVMTCLAVGSSVAIPLLVLMWMFDRGGKGTLLPWLAPLGAWLAGMATLQAHCPIVAHEHQWGGHFGVIVPVTVVWLLLWRVGAGSRR